MEVLDQLEQVAGEEGYVNIQARAALKKCALRVYAGEEGARIQARRTAEELLGVFDAAGDHFGLARAYYMLAYLEWEAYSFTAVDVALKQALLHVRQGGSSNDEAAILSATSASLLLGPTPAEQGVARLRELLQIAEGNRVLEPTLHLRLGVLLAMQGEFAEARELVGKARSTWKELGQTFALARSSQEAGVVEILANDFVAAEKELKEGCATLKEMGETAFFATTAALLARALCFQERWDEAEQAAKESEEAAGENIHVKGEWAPTRARLLAHRGELEAAEQLARDAIEVIADQNVFFRGYGLTSLADVLAAAGKNEEAMEVATQALVQYERKGMVLFAERIRDWQQTLAAS
jgi:ATP/maltotriose-dependent transcriptional regulator MalT